MNIETSFSLQKRSESEETNQDAIAISPDERVFAIADGVSQSPFSQIWSKKVVNKFIKKPLDISDLNEQKIKDWLADIRKEWRTEIDQGKASELILDLAKKEGGATTFLGMIIQKKKKKRQKLQLFGIGDTNMFLVKKNEITGKLDVVGWPVTSVESFTDRTNALFSLDNTSQGIPELKEFNVKRGDIVILATDALAKWILEYYNLGQRPWSKILKNKNDIANFIDKLRYTNKIDDDDTTCIIIRI